MFLLSVIIPTYNAESTLEKCLKSLTSQTFKGFEICLLDGASGDQTLAIAASFHPTFKNLGIKLRIISEPDRGVYDAMNNGINVAQGQWLYFLGSDDQIADPDVFADVFTSIIPAKHGIVYGNVYICDDTSWSKAGQIYDGGFDIRKLLIQNICHQAIFYRRSLFQKWGMYNINYPINADLDLNLRFFPRTRALYLDRVIAKFAGGGLSSGEIDVIRYDLEKLRARALMAYRLHRLTSFGTFR
jgi:glycosyltransferase involved in cell wall biosynthesis